jgi:hypothetical protein
MGRGKVHTKRDPERPRYRWEDKIKISFESKVGRCELD